MKVSVNRGKENAYLDIMGEEDAGPREKKKIWSRVAYGASFFPFFFNLQFPLINE